MMSKPTISVLLLMLFACYLSGANLESIKATDSGNTVNNISVTLSDSETYSVSSSADGKTHRLSIQNTDVGSIRPDYKRLSRVIDKISCSQEGSNTIVVIQTMEASQISHSQSGAKISLRIAQGNGTPEPTTAKPLRDAEPSPGAPLRPEAPAIPIPKATPQQVIDPDTVDNNLYPDAPMPDPLGGYDEENVVSFFAANWAWIIFGAIGIILLALAFWFGMRTPKEKILDAEEDRPTFIMDSAAKKRMVMRLADQSWTAAQIAAELRLPIQDVQRIINEPRKKN